MLDGREQIKALLKRFEEAYHRKNLDGIDRFVEANFIEESPVYYGTSGLEQFVGREQIAHLLYLDWKEWGILSFNYDQMQIHATDDFGDFITTASLEWEIPEDIRFQRMVDDVKAVANSTNVTRAQIERLALKLAYGIGEMAEGEVHRYDLRVSGAVQKVDGLWKFTSIHMSESNI